MMVVSVLFYYQCPYLEKYKNNQTMPIHQMFAFNFTTEIGGGGGPQKITGKGE